MSATTADVRDVQPRHHGVDAIRAGLMLLGVVLHTASTYQKSAPDGAWPIRDPDRSDLAGLFVGAVHLVRMPAFFVMAGFFAALAFERRGAWRFVLERLRRIALPLVVGWAVLFPIVKASFTLAMVRAQTVSLADAARMLPSVMESPYSNPSLMHLWFLWYLLVMNLFSAPLAFAIRGLPVKFRESFDRAIDAFTFGSLRWACVPLLSLIAWLLLRLMPSPFIDTPSSFVIDARIFACYALFYLCGWMLYRRRTLIEGWKLSAWRRAILAAVAYAVALVAVILWFGLLARGEVHAAAIVLPIAQALTAAATWLLVIGGVALAEHLITRSSVVIRLLVDASYWIYLAHLPLCILVPLALRDWHAPAMLKMLASIAITTASLLAVYGALRVVLPPRRSAFGDA